MNQHNNQIGSAKQGFKKQIEDEGEYEQCFETWRFFLGFRSTLFVFSFTVMSALLYLYFSKDDNGNLLLDDFPRRLVSLLGFIFTFAIITIELRNRQMYSKSLDRARAIELNGEQPPAFKYGDVALLVALWRGTKDFLKDLKWLFIKRPDDNKNPEENEYRLATLLIKTPIHLFSWMTGGILFVYLTMLIVWLTLCIWPLWEKLKTCCGKWF